jgi:hypothetical protein
VPAAATTDTTPVTSVPVPVAAVMSAADSAAFVRDLRIAQRDASNESTARTALIEADTLAARSPRAEDRVRVAMVRAQAFGTLGQDGRSCQALRDGVSYAKGTSYEASLTAALSRCQ